MPNHDETAGPDADLINGALSKLRDDLPAELDPDDAVDDGADIPAELTFTTDSGPDTAEDDERDILPIKLDGMVLYARKPADGAWTMILAAVSRSATTADKTAATLDFIYAAFDEPSQMLLKSRMLDPDDAFGVNNLATIMTALIEKWAPPASRRDRRAALRRRGPARR